MKFIQRIILRLFSKQPKRIPLSVDQVRGVIIQARMRTGDNYDFSEKEILFEKGFDV